MSEHTFTTFEGLAGLLAGGNTSGHAKVVISGYSPESGKESIYRNFFFRTRYGGILTAFEQFALVACPASRITQADTWIHAQADQSVFVVAFEPKPPAFGGVSDQQEQAVAVAELASFTDGG